MVNEKAEEARSRFTRYAGRQVRNARLLLDWSQAELVRRASFVCTQASLSNYESGRRDMPLSTFVTLAAALGTTPNRLLHTEAALAFDPDLEALLALASGTEEGEAR